MVVNYFDYKKNPLVLCFKRKKKKGRKEKENGIVKYNKYVNVKFISSRKRTVNILICCIINTFFSFWQKAFSKCRSSVADPNEICKQISRHAVYFMQILSSIKSEDISILLCVNLQLTHYMLYGDERIQMGWSLCYLFCVYHESIMEWSRSGCLMVSLAVPERTTVTSHTVWILRRFVLIKLCQYYNILFDSEWRKKDCQGSLSILPRFNGVLSMKTSQFLSNMHFSR